MLAVKTESTDCAVCKLAPDAVMEKFPVRELFLWSPAHGNKEINKISVEIQSFTISYVIGRFVCTVDQINTYTGSNLLKNM